MDLASRLIWRCFIETPSNESARKSKFCQIIWVTFITLWFHEFFQLLLILSSSKILCRFFCQIIMGSPLNSNVPDGRSVESYVDKLDPFLLRNLLDIVASNGHYWCLRKSIETRLEELVFAIYFPKHFTLIPCSFDCLSSL